ncbi:unnamed protein product [Onchocerca ochengi]|uniref:NR LBD domain-containing protein n=1 Tax=Onchocerca ochengi TaxID=42157 RepID=A0A182EWC1_ONCOC|nr:unnamed protein product [Onchocerca ochengi]
MEIAITANLCKSEITKMQKSLPKIEMAVDEKNTDYLLLILETFIRSNNGLRLQEKTMSSLKALLNSKSFDSVTTSNLEMTNINGRKRGAALEEWLLRKFPELYRKSHDLESTTVAVNDVENQPLSMLFVF